MNTTIKLAFQTSVPDPIFRIRSNIYLKLHHSGWHLCATGGCENHVSRAGNRYIACLHMIQYIDIGVVGINRIGDGPTFAPTICAAPQCYFPVALHGLSARSHQGNTKIGAGGAQALFQDKTAKRRNADAQENGHQHQSNHKLDQGKAL
jgi:hypothetical protein